MSAPALPVGAGRDRLRLFDNQWRVLWDSATDATPAYRHIATWVNAAIDYPDGTRRALRLERRPEGIRREFYEPEFLKYFLSWPTIEAVS